jgi:ATP-dependent Clp protease protease subunit
MSVPYVIEKSGKNGERTYDLYSRLLKDRTIFIKGVFNQDMADSVVAQLLFLESADNKKDINLYINSPGGEITAMFSIFDTMTYIKPDISALAYGQACSAGSFLLAGATKGKRGALINASLMVHELSGGSQGKFNDMKLAFKHSEALYNKMADYYVKFTGQDLDKIKKDMERDHYLTAEEAKEYGLIDKVYESR